MELFKIKKKMYAIRLKLSCVAIHHISNFLSVLLYFAYCFSSILEVLCFVFLIIIKTKFILFFKCTIGLRLKISYLINVLYYYFRNCLVGKAYQIKISDFGTDNEAYASDYYNVNGSMPLPVRWMAWESVFMVRGAILLFCKLFNFEYLLYESFRLLRLILIKFSRTKYSFWS